MAVSINGNYTNSEYSSGLRNSSSAAQSSSEGVGRNGAGINAKSLSTGSMLSGEVVAKDGNTVTLKLANNQTISARLDGNSEVSVGQKLTFEVAKNSSNQTLLRPLYSNLAANSAVSTALKEAMLPITERNVAFTTQMMKEGMSISRNALIDMSKSINLFPDADPTTLVQMNKIGLEINQNNISQFDNYKNFQHQIINDSSIIGDGLANLIDESIEGFKGDFSNTINITNEILGLVDTDSLEILNPDNETLIVNTDSGQNVSGLNIDFKVNEDLSVLPDVNGKMAPIMNDETVSEPDTIMKNQDTNLFMANDNLSLTGAEQENLLKQLNDTLQLVGRESVVTSPLDPKEVLSQIKTLVNENLGVSVEEDIPQFVDTITDENEVVAKEGELNKVLTENGTNLSDSSSLNTVNNKQMDPFDMIRNIGQKIFGGNQTENKEIEVPTSLEEKINASISNLLKSDNFKKLLSDCVKAQFTIDPKDVAKEGKIEELYERILKTSSKVNEMMQQMGKAESQIAKSASNIADNVHFMDQLNQYVSYVQLPLKMAGEDAHGELCVYTKNKKLKENDGNFTALLHLDMDHLGPMDVYVTMKEYTNVNTHFYLQDEAMLDFLCEHINELTDRLTKKGYNASSNISYKSPNEPIKPITEEFVKNDSGTVSQIVSKVCFDVRA